MQDITPETTVPPSTNNQGEKLANGIFFNRYTPAVKKGQGPPTMVNDTRFQRLVMSLDHIPDGASNTLMLSENLQAYKYTANVNTGGNDVFETNNSYPAQYDQGDLRQVELSTGFVWNPSYTSNPTGALRINGNKNGDAFLPKVTTENPPKASNMNNPNHWVYARPSSAHSGGVNVAMCGGELFFLRDDIDYKVYNS